jgi:pyruvate,water dikinase
VRHRVLHRLDPRPPARRLRAAWRTGRLTRALPALARDVVEQVDRDLAAVPRVDELSNAALLAVLDNGRTALRALHGYEALAGMLVPASDETATAASLALSALAEARAEGVDLDELVESSPVVLALAPPRIGSDPELTFGPVPTIDLRDGAPSAAPAVEPASDDAVVREALRLRARWVQELTSRAAWQLGHRLMSVGVLRDQQSVRLLGLDELRTSVRTRSAPVDLHVRPDPVTTPPRPLPAQFRLTPDNTPVAVAPPTAGPGGVGAGGGAGSGPVHVGDDPPAGAVLVVTHLDPRLAPVIPRLAGLVAETGSPLSHLAILAREHGVPTVVGHLGATERYRNGDLVEVDGVIGTVQVIDRRAEPAEPADRVPGAGRTTVITLPTRPVVDLTDEAQDDDDGDDGDAAPSPGANIIPIGARR